MKLLFLPIYGIICDIEITFLSLKFTHSGEYEESFKMQNIESLRRQLTHEEYTQCTQLWRACRDIGIDVSTATAMCYRAGKLKVKEEYKQEKGKLHKELHQLREENRILKLGLMKANTEPQAVESTETPLDQPQGEE